MKLHKQLYIQVLLSILIGITLGHFYPELAVKMKPLGDGFIKLIKMMVAPIIFTTVVTGIANMKNTKEVGRIGIKAIIYFEVVTSLALLIGLVVVNLHRPGAGLNIDVNTLGNLSHYSIVQPTEFNAAHFFLKIIPDTLMGAFLHGDILPVLLIAILFGFALLHGAKKLQSFTRIIEQFSTVLFNMVGFVVKIAPIGVFGAMAYTIGAHGIVTLTALGAVLADVYLTCVFFIFIVLGLIARLNKFSLWRFLNYIKEELFIVVGTASTEVVLPRMMQKLEALGCGKTVVGLVLPAGYTLNMDGTSIYLTIATIFIAQALNIDLSFTQQLMIFAVALITSKGAAAVTGGGFIVLLATLSSIHTIPLAGVILLLGIDRFMSEARALTNLIGNGIATIVIAKWEKDFDAVAAQKALAMKVKNT